MPLPPPETAARTRRTIIDIASRRLRPGSGAQPGRAEKIAHMMWPDPSKPLAGLPWAVVGGVGTRLYMRERMTRDLDIAVLAEDHAEVRRRLLEAGYKARGESTVGTMWEAPDGTQLDVVIGEEDWWREALAEAQENRDQQGLPVLPLPYLVVVKLLSGRPQDIADVSRMLAPADDDTLDRVRSTVERLASSLREDVDSLIELGKIELRRQQERE